MRTLSRLWWCAASLATAAALTCAAPASAADGAALFAQNCAMCHQSDAAGLPGQFPRLKGRVAAIGTRPKGRGYLIDIVTYGMAGSITVDDQPIVGVMPQLQLTDDDTAQVLSFVAGLGGKQPAPFTAEEVAARRAGPPKTGADVLAERRLLQTAKALE
jgi:mono/diheme cytochrome c family protein